MLLGYVGGFCKEGLKKQSSLSWPDGSNCFASPWLKATQKRSNPLSNTWKQSRQKIANCNLLFKQIMVVPTVSAWSPCSNCKLRIHVDSSIPVTFPYEIWIQTYSNCQRFWCEYHEILGFSIHGHSTSSGAPERGRVPSPLLGTGNDLLQKGFETLWHQDNSRVDV